MNAPRSVLLSFAATALVALAAPVVAAPVQPASVARDLAQLRQATAAFHRLDHAFIAGWTQDITGCLASPEGGMGYHFANFGALSDGVAEALRPELLVYAPSAGGGLKLVAVEYLVFADQLPEGAPIPMLFGQHFHFNPAVEAWVLHAWIWEHNPSGMFADWNPRISCD